MTYKNVYNLKLTHAKQFKISLNIFITIENLNTNTVQFSYCFTDVEIICIL